LNVFGEAMGLIGQIVFWCLMPMGGKIRPKQLDQLPLVKFSKVLMKEYFIAKNYSLMGEKFDYGKRRVFGI
jgi:hypothetical protein